MDYAGGIDNHTPGKHAKESEARSWRGILPKPVGNVERPKFPYGSTSPVVLGYQWVVAVLEVGSRQNEGGWAGSWESR